MMRLPRFRFLAPQSIEEACRILAAEGPAARVMAGGTDLLPNMKRRQQTPKVLVGLRQLASMQGCTLDGATVVGANMTLTQVARHPALRARHEALQKAAYSVATPHLRNMGTLGGNLCLDTRCNYYDQTYEWRRSIDFCMKKDGKICWVAPSSPRCWAVSSTDTAPALLALGAQVTLVSHRGERELPIDQFFNDDGMAYLTKQPDEILTSVRIPSLAGWASTYVKCRRRGSFDFPILSVAAALKAKDGVIEELRVVLGAVASRPLLVDTTHFRGQRLTDDVIEDLASRAARVAHPLDNTDLHLNWRKRVAREYAVAALKEVRGDGPQPVPTGHVPEAVINEGCPSCA